mmetsp:Transcript_24566/g.33870  ORF Transcript_24566/g.33870 Transcript_24566/m.33870 type:complete len:328 (+) Transcript_24566:197-1180(+)|eukprot:CAMPEP_0196582734 /NCGR_PEP_ID=MMETSP1081-20130531/40353_1 /TAXON_ID=36882 /ORGANISM="Pyramimonas amylifera, Strain CCMP720" /LENGTH=327 /DNA_ID=CAMNT_0041903397 /DNA_START=191 /DNA_END=1174 /DNA_ORIENTATION=+
MTTDPEVRHRSIGLREPLLERHSSEDSLDERKKNVNEGMCDIGGVLGGMIAGCARAFILMARSLGLIPSAPPPPLTSEQQASLARLYQRTTVPYDSESESHRLLLLQLWKACFPSLPAPPLADPRSDLWREVGWQNSNPAGDFRAGGLQALLDLVSLAHTHPTTFHALRHKSRGRRSDWEYPFCAAGVNVTFALTQLLHLRTPPTSSSTSSTSKLPSSPSSLLVTRAFLSLACPTTSSSQPDIEIPQWELEFEEMQWGSESKVLGSLYAATWEILDAEWLARGATYMEFPKVLQATLARVENLLVSGSFKSAEDLYSYACAHPLVDK